MVSSAVSIAHKHERRHSQAKVQLAVSLRSEELSNRARHDSVAPEALYRVWSVPARLSRGDRWQGKEGKGKEGKIPQTCPQQVGVCWCVGETPARRCRCRWLMVCLFVRLFAFSLFIFSFSIFLISLFGFVISSFRFKLPIKPFNVIIKPNVQY